MLKHKNSSHPRNHRPPRSDTGFTLVELLVALIFTSLLMTGMAQVFRHSLNAFSSSNEVLGAQRVNRWALDLISDDLSQAGFIYPDRTLPTSITVPSTDPPFFSLTPNALTVFNGVAHENIPSQDSDVLQLFMDYPLPVQGTLAPRSGSTEIAINGEEVTFDPSTGNTTAQAADTGCTINFTQGSSSQLARGDFMIILDSGEKGKWEHPLIDIVNNNAITFIPPPSSLMGTISGTPMNSTTVLQHPAGVSVYFIRPLQLIRYSLQAINLDPANRNLTVPCLVRQRANYLDVKASSDRGTFWRTDARVATEIIAENAERFCIDISRDGGNTWGKTELLPVGADFRTQNALFRVEVRTRVPIRRTEDPNGPLRYRTRTQTIVISPRNFGLGV